MNKRIFTALLILLGGLFVSSRSALATEVRPMLFPVIGKTNFTDDFGAPRVGHTHQGNDVFATKHTPLVAAVDGTIAFVTWPEASYGYFVSIRGDDGYDYWYIHINNDNPGTDDGRGGGNNAYAPGIENGARVVEGQLIGWVGDSGNAETTPAHLHFEIHTPDHTVIDPYWSLRNARHATKPVIGPAAAGEILPFAEFRGGANVAVGNVDSTKSGNELVVGAGAGGGPLVRIFDAENNPDGHFYAYPQTFRGGIDVAVGDVTGDGVADIITAPQAGFEPRIRIFKMDGTLESEFLAYAATYKNGVHVSVADLDGDGTSEIITGPGIGMKPEVKTFTAQGTLLYSWMAYTELFRGGVDVVGISAIPGSEGQVVTSPLRGGGPEVRTFALDGTMRIGFFAYTKTFRGGVRISASRALDGTASIMTIPATVGSSQVRQFTQNGQAQKSWTVFEPWWRGGFDIAADGERIVVSTAAGGRRAAIRSITPFVPTPPPGFEPPVVVPE